MEIDRRREVRRVAEAAGLAFDAHDLAVETFGHAVRDRVLDEPEHAGEMTLPARPFYKPLARALIEERQILALDANSRQKVTSALDAMSTAREIRIRLKDVESQSPDSRASKPQDSGRAHCAAHCAGGVRRRHVALAPVLVHEA